MFHQDEADKDACMWANVASHLKQKGIKQGYVSFLFNVPMTIHFEDSWLPTDVNIVLKTVHNWLLHFKTEPEYFLPVSSSDGQTSEKIYKNNLRSYLCRSHTDLYHPGLHRARIPHQELLEL